MNRNDLANSLAAGLGGWLQLQAVQRLDGLSGEDSARLVTCQIINAQGRFEPATSQLPSNWGSTKNRVDVAIKARSESATTWYGAIELKWPSDSFDISQVRTQIIQDAMRLIFIDTNVLNAKFLILGGSSLALEKLFKRPHSRSIQKEQQRTAFGQILSRDVDNPRQSTTFGTWSENFPEAGNRTPGPVFGDYRGRLKTGLLAHYTANVGSKAVGAVYVWQCNKTKGSAAH